MSRRSARLQNKMAPKPNSPISAQEEDNYEPVAEKPTKRRRTAKEPVTAPKRKRTKGKLRDLVNLPLDVLFEIFSELTPYDLLRLSRASKAFRSVLLSKSSRSVWKASLRKIPHLPPCPSFLSEPAFVNLLYDNSCFFCGTHTPSVDWMWLKRCCKQCAKIEIEPVYDRADHHLGVVILRVLERQGKINSNQDDQVLEPPFSNLEEQLFHELSMELLNVLPAFAPYLDEFADIAAHENEEVLEEWVEKKLEYGEEANLFRIQCEAWQQIEAENRSMKKCEIRAERVQTIRKKLTDLGWQEEFDKMTLARRCMFEEHAFVKQPKALTERVWANHQAEMIELMVAIKEKRLRFQREQILERLCLLIEAMDDHGFESAVFPRFADIYLMPDFNAWLRHDPLWDWVRSSHVILYEAVENLGSSIAQWTKDKDKELLTLLDSEDSPDVLQLATTYFKCHSCTEPVAYPRILVHRHITEHHPTPHALDWDPTLVDERGTDQDWFDEVGMIPWGCDNGRIHVHTLAKEVAESLLDACGLDPLVTTKSDIDDNEPYFACMDDNCLEDKKRQVMSWDRAMLHALEKHGGDLPPWKKVTLKQKRQAKKKQVITTYSFPAYSLPQCGKHFAQSWGEIKDHLLYSHGLMTPALGRDYEYFIDLDMEHSAPTEVLIAI